MLDNNLDSILLQSKDIMHLRIQEEDKQREKEKKQLKEKLLKEANEEWSQDEQNHLE